MKNAHTTSCERCISPFIDTIAMAPARNCMITKSLGSGATSRLMSTTTMWVKKPSGMLKNTVTTMGTSANGTRYNSPDLKWAIT